MVVLKVTLKVTFSQRGSVALLVGAGDSETRHSFQIPVPRQKGGRNLITNNILRNRFYLKLEKLNFEQNKSKCFRCRVNSLNLVRSSRQMIPTHITHIPHLRQSPSVGCPDQIWMQSGCQLRKPRQGLAIRLVELAAATVWWMLFCKFDQM